MKKQQKDEQNNELKEENVILQRKLQGRLLKENICINDYSQHGSQQN